MAPSTPEAAASHAPHTGPAPGAAAQAVLAPARKPKPPYHIPSVAEIQATPKNGYRLVSTFSGCGGSCLGFEWAGFTPIWANEFIPAAADTYEANHQGVPMDRRDIRKITVEHVLQTTGLAAGECDVLEGSPPCASFSSSGDIEDGWGHVRKYSSTHQRVDDLFFEFIRLLAGIRPKTFISENVPGLVHGKAKGMFKIIHRAMSDAGYHVESRILRCESLGVPQARHRLIFFGVRSDLGLTPRFPSPLPYQYSMHDALDSISGVPRVEMVVHDTRGRNKVRSFTDTRTCSTITVSGGVASYHYKVFRHLNLGREWARLRRGEQSKKYMNLVRTDPDKPCPTVCQRGGGAGVASVTHWDEPRKFTMLELRRLCGFPDDFVLTGTYDQQWERLGRAVCPPMMRAVGECVAEVLRGSAR